jgi:hypothetical protein
MSGTCGNEVREVECRVREGIGPQINHCLSLVLLYVVRVFVPCILDFCCG